MKTLNALPKIVAILFFIIAVASCDEDFNNIGVDIIGDDNLQTQLYESENIVSYSRLLDPIQTNIIPVQNLGIYNDHVYGKSTANYITQVTLSETDPIFGDTLGQPIIFESAILYIPYYSEATVGEEETTYTLDSIYGDTPIKISMYESEFFLRNLDPNSSFENRQLYYSNQGSQFENYLGELIITLEDFMPSDEGFVLVEGEGDDEVETLIAPGIRVELPMEYFQEKIFDKEGESVLSNNNNFKEYFRGLYFKVESNTEDGSLFIFDPTNANITLSYNFERPDLDPLGEPVLDENGEPIIDIIDEEFSINFGGVNLNTYTNELPQSIISDIENPDLINGEENLYVRGGEGVIAVIDLFSGEDLDDNGVADELDELRIRELLVNDASLKFYVDQDKIVGGNTEPERLIIYNLKNNTVLADYFLDTTSGNEPVDALTTHLGRLERNSDDLGEYYSIRVTNFVSNLINKDSTNVSLGLMVSQNVLLSGFQAVDSLTNPDSQSPRIKEVPRSGVISPEGTVLYGNNAINVDKRLKLQIQYIEPN